MYRHSPILAVCALALLALTLASAPASAAPASTPVAAKPTSCPRQTNLNHWTARSVERAGFFVEQVGGAASSVAFNGHSLSLSVAATTQSGYVASRITDIDTSVPISERPRCWQATPEQDIVVSYRIRFHQAQVSQGMTENQMLWNASLPNPALPPEAPQPLSAFGVSRSQGMYMAVAVQSLDLTTFQAAMYQTQPMPSWVRQSDWHTISLRLSADHITIAVEQDGQQAVVLDSALPEQPAPLGFEFSVDNEAMPGQYPPISVPDGIDIASYRIKAVKQ